MEDLVSVIISSFNRYDLLLNAIESVKNQTYNNIEIIVIDDGSVDDRYREPISGVEIINLGQSNSRSKLGYPSCGYVRNFGFKIGKGKYIAILDDDDYWLSTKIEKQVNILKKTGLLLACTESFICHQNINSKTNINNLQLYNREYWWEALKKKLNLDQDFSNILNSTIINKHNCIICSSVLFNRKLLDLVGYMQPVKNWSGSNGIYQDWDYWKKTTQHSNIYYIKEPLMIYYHSEKKNYCTY
jgi:glycosyltransferase involved in cell wall biosynthesis